MRLRVFTVILILTIACAVSASCSPGNESQSKKTDNSSTSTSVAVSTKKKLEKSEIDIIAIGSSNVYRYFIPAVFYDNYAITSLVAANASLPGKVIKHYIGQAQKDYAPEMFVVDLRTFIRRQEQRKRAGKLLERSYNSVSHLTDKTLREKAATAVLNEGADEKLGTDELKAMYPKWYAVSEQDEFLDENNPFKGYKPSSNHAIIDGTDCSGVTETAEISKDNKADLTDLLDYCKANSLTVLFTLAPYNMTEKDMQLSNCIAKIVSEYGYAYLDANKLLSEMNINFKTDFYNNMHTNAYGSQKYSSYLADYINKNYQIDKALSEKLTGEWKKTVSYYQTEYKKIYETILKKLQTANVADLVK